MVQIYRILGNRKPMVIIECLLNSKDEISQTEIIKKTKIAKATAVKWLSVLAENKIASIRKIGTTNLYAINLNNIIVRELKKIYTLSLLSSIEKNLEEEAYLYGSAARGEDTPDSDIDLLLIGNKKREEKIESIERISKKIKRRINFAIFTNMEWLEIGKRDKPFFERVEKDKIRLL